MNTIRLIAILSVVCLAKATTDNNIKLPPTTMPSPLQSLYAPTPDISLFVKQLLSGFSQFSQLPYSFPTIPNNFQQFSIPYFIQFTPLGPRVNCNSNNFTPPIQSLVEPLNSSNTLIPSSPTPIESPPMISPQTPIVSSSTQPIQPPSNSILSSPTSIESPPKSSPTPIQSLCAPILTSVHQDQHRTLLNKEQLVRSIPSSEKTESTTIIKNK